MNNPFQKMINKASDFFQKNSNRSVVGIDIGSSSIKVVQLKNKNGRAVIETYGTLSLGPYAKIDIGAVTNLNTEIISLAVTDVIKESGVNTIDASFSIPSTASLLFVINLPGNISEKDFATIIPTEARKYIPVPISEVALDWWLIPKKEESLNENDENFEKIETQSMISKTEVLVAVIQNDMISKYQNIVSKTSLSSSFYEIEMFSNIRANFSHELSSVMLIDFGASKTKIVIIDYGIVRIFHIINRGGQDITSALSKSMNISFKDAEEIKRNKGLSTSPEDRTISDIIRLSTDYIFSEANSLVLNYEKKYNKVVSKVVLSGGGAMLKGLPDLATINFKCEVVTADPFTKVLAPAFLNPVLKEIGPEFSVAIGLALRQLTD